jgi:hypothetical protein
MSSESHKRLEGLEERMAERGESLRGRRLRHVKVLMVKLRKFIGTKKWRQFSTVSTVSTEERGDSLRRVIDSKCPWSNHLSNVE